MGSRLEFQEVLESLLGSTNVYFQPPPTLQMSYPCVTFRRSGIQTKSADNKPYSQKTLYSVTVIDKNPDSAIPAKVGELIYSKFDRAYAFDGLNHDVYSVYF